MVGRKRTVGIMLVFGAALPLAVASVAWACGVLSTLTIDKKVASPGQSITISGKNYANTVAGGASPVTVRLKSRKGAVLTTVAATAGRISDTFTIPASVSPGWYVVLATQSNADGSPKAGTPGRTTLRIQGSSTASAVPAAAPWSSSPPSGPAASHATAGSGSGGGPLPAILLASALSLMMLVGGWKLLSRKSDAASEPQPVY
jgi:hypothetical protein